MKPNYLLSAVVASLVVVGATATWFLDDGDNLTTEAAQGALNKPDSPETPVETIGSEAMPPSSTASTAANAVVEPTTPSSVDPLVDGANNPAETTTSQAVGGDADSSSTSESVQALEAPTPEATMLAVRFENRTSDITDFDSVALGILTDSRGWGRAGFAVVHDPNAEYRLVLAEGSEVDSLCAPYNTRTKYSCQIGSTVALNAERWRSATDTWPASLAEYRTMLVNHEFGHLLGQHHPKQSCSSPGGPAPVMWQQSTGVKGCSANPWPLEWEISCAAARIEPIAPGYEPSASPICDPTTLG